MDVIKKIIRDKREKHKLAKINKTDKPKLNTNYKNGSNSAKTIRAKDLMNDILDAKCTNRSLKNCLMETMAYRTYVASDGMPIDELEKKLSERLDELLSTRQYLAK